ncbi:uncharacterized protein A4U43_C07F11060 [Asparagus officinalis]|uniref:Glycine-rich protein n=1 Tax=Asparagus officinalis TaxID=4686 RepID=A0A5P1EAZ4_ASPOF|nr:uncharacterized protein A4U43_C07F11060 [Asparagus officinalis]
MEKSTKVVMVLALMLATSLVTLEARQLKGEPKYKPQTFPGFPGGPPLGTGTGLLPGIGLGLGQPGFGSGSPLVPGGGIPSFGIPTVPGGGSGGGFPGWSAVKMARRCVSSSSKEVNLVYISCGLYWLFCLELDC